MTLTEIRALLKAHGYKTTAAIDRFDVKRGRGAIVGAEVMFTSGEVAYMAIGQ